MQKVDYSMTELEWGGLIESTLVNYAKKLTQWHVCASCQCDFVPLFAMGRRECYVHPEKSNNVDGNFHNDQACRAPSITLGGRFACCGTYRTDTRLDWRGCTRADHHGSLDWFSGEPPLAGYRLFATFHPILSNPSLSDRMSDAAGKRFVVLPYYAVHYIALHRNRILDQKGALKTSILRIQIEGKTAVEISRQLLGDAAQLVDDANALVGMNAVVACDIGVGTVYVDLRDAYFSMCKEFNIPYNIITQKGAQYLERQTTMSNSNMQGDEFIDKIETDPHVAQLLYDAGIPDADVILDGLQSKGDERDRAFSASDYIASLTGDVPLSDQHVYQFFPFVIAPWIDKTDTTSNRTLSPFQNKTGES